MEAVGLASVKMNKVLRRDSALSMRLRPLTNKLAARLGRTRDLAAAAVETVIEQAEERERHIPPAFLPSQLEKARAGAAGQPSGDYELSLATRNDLVHMPVVRYVLEDCLVHAAGVEHRGGSLRIQELKPSFIAARHIRRVPQALYCMSGVSHQFFGHWLQDSCATAFLRQEDEALLLTKPAAWPHAHEYAVALGLAPEPWELLRVDRLTVYDDFSQGSSKRRRYAEMRRRLETAFGGSRTAGRRVYFRRGATGVVRLVANEDAVIASLQRRGFEVFDLAGASAQQIYARFRDAEFVVSLDGSHLNHLYFSMQPGARLMTFVPGDRFTMTQLGYCAAAGLRYGFMVVDPTPAGYHVSIADLNDSLDLMGLTEIAA